MCGIAGIIDFTGRIDKRPATEKMLSVISYRGPDQSGIYHSTLAALGNVRLSIIDLEGGHQPLCDSSGRFWIIINGEIFNYKELRRDLEKKGIIFRTQSDTEVLVELYALHGEKCLSMLNGQFAFAIWDKMKEELFMARDRIGIRPFFYHLDKGLLSFASEIKSLFQLEHISRELNPGSLSQVYTFWTCITPDTAFKDIYELSPGHCAVYSREGLKIKKYWDLLFDNIRENISLTDAVEQFHEVFSDAVRLRLRADVEVAAYLSGGIDSSGTVACIKDTEPGILNTFSIGFDEKDFDESRYQAEAVGYFRTNHKSYQCTTQEITGKFPNVVWHSEMPLTRTAPTPMFLLSKLVRENNIKVVITGEGSDEILAGYDIFKETVIRRFWASQPRSSLRPLLLKKLYPYIPQISQSSAASLRMFFGYKLEDLDNPFYSHLLRWNNANYIRKHFSDDLKESLKDHSPTDRLENSLPTGFHSWDPLAKAQWLETTIFMSGYLLSSQGDRMAMANSVEGRYPFLDYRVMEFCSALPAKFKLRGLTEKYLLKKLLTGKIPESIIKRTKQPYRAPVKNVFLSGDPPEYVRQMLSESYTRRAGIFNHDSLATVLQRIQKTGTSSEMDDMLLTSVISTHLLYHQFIEDNNKEFQKGKLKDLRLIEDSNQ